MDTAVTFGAVLMLIPLLVRARNGELRNGVGLLWESCLA